MRRVALLVLLPALFACARYEWRTPSCPPEPLARSQAGWHPDTTRPGVIYGRIRYLIDDRPAAGAQVALPPWHDWSAVEPDGTFELSAAAAGSVVLRVRQIGYAVAEVPVTVSPTSGAGVEVRLLHQANLDGCHFMVRARKPWWKLW